MISDLLKILNAIQTSQSDEQREELESELLRKVQSEIEALFTKFPERRRTFGAIREALGIFDPPAKQEELKQILFDLGARPKNGKGDQKYWHLPLVEELSETSSGSTWKGWRLVYSIVLLAFLVSAAYGLFKVFTLSSILEIGSLEECLKQKNLSMKEISKCFRDYQ